MPRSMRRSRSHERAIQTAFVGVVLASLFIQDASADDLQTAFQTRISPLLKTYCLDCHNPEDHKGELDLTKFSSLKHVQSRFSKFGRPSCSKLKTKRCQPKSRFRRHRNVRNWSRGSKPRWRQSTGRSKPASKSDAPSAHQTRKQQHSSRFTRIDFRPGDMLLDDGQGLSGSTTIATRSSSHRAGRATIRCADYALEAVAALKTPPMRKVFEAEQMLMTERGSRPEELPGEAGSATRLPEPVSGHSSTKSFVPVDGWYRITVRCCRDRRR